MNENVILAISLAVPNLLAVLMGILVNNSRLSDTNARIGDVRAEIGSLRSHMDQWFDGMRSEMNHRFDDMRDNWRSELHRVEEILDARLKHLEER